MNIYQKIKFYAGRYLFEHWAIPSVSNEKISKSLLKKYLPSNAVIVDCGAHDGEDTVGLAKIFKAGTIHAFEPLSHLHQRLLKNTAPCENIHCYQLALADRNGEMDFYISEGESDASSSLLPPKDHLVDHPDTFFKNKTTVPTKTLGGWAKENNIQQIHMLWLDMQGFELSMLKAAGPILDSVKVIHTEVSMRETYQDVPTYMQYRTFLESIGFKVVIEAIPAGWDMGNVLFVRNQ